MGATTAGRGTNRRRRPGSSASWGTRWRHSLSPRLHNAAFARLGLDWVSVGFAVPGGQAAGALAGARALGIAGTVGHHAPQGGRGRRSRLVQPGGRPARGGQLRGRPTGTGGTGDNTDGAGLWPRWPGATASHPDGPRCLVVGAGGAARAVIAALGDAGAAEVVVVNRTAGRAEDGGATGRSGRAGRDRRRRRGVRSGGQRHPGGHGRRGGRADGVAGRPGPAGPGPAGGGPRLPPAASTPWLAAAADAGRDRGNGLGMLVHQAALQIERWTGRTAPVEAMWASVAGPGHDERPEPPGGAGDARGRPRRGG